MKKSIEFNLSDTIFGASINIQIHIPEGSTMTAQEAVHIFENIRDEIKMAEEDMILAREENDDFTVGK